MKVHVSKLGRNDLLKWIVKGDGTPPTEYMESSGVVLDNETVALVWINDKQITPFVCVDGSNLRSFFAFSDTYISEMAPITAFWRVVPIQYIDFLPDNASPKAQKMLLGFIGCMIADAASQIGEPFKKVDDITIQACLATRSAAGAMGAWIGYSPEVIDIIIERFEAGRKKLGFDIDISGSIAASQVWKSIGNCNYRSDRAIKKSLIDFLKINMMAGRDLTSEKEISKYLPSEIIYLVERLKGPREDRVRALNEISASVLRMNFDQQEIAALIGVLTAQAAEGSFSYLPLVSSLSSGDYATRLWFGVAAGMHPESDILSVGGALGRRLTRYITNHDLYGDRPIADISLDHLLAISDNENPSRFRREIQGVLRVEIMPGVIGSYRMGRAQQTSFSSPQAAELLRTMANQLLHVAHQVDPGPLRSSSIPLGNYQGSYDKEGVVKKSSKRVVRQKNLF